jgi:hypothetical protein
MDQPTYEKPRIEDYGTLQELTGACFGTGATDELGKTWGIAARSQPLNGDSDTFCAG